MARAAAPLPIARELWDFEALGEVMDRILDGQRELTPAEQKNLRGIYDKLYRKVAAPHPVSEGRLRELAAKWRGEARLRFAMAHPCSNWEANEISRLADELERALESA